MYLYPSTWNDWMRLTVSSSLADTMGLHASVCDLGTCMFNIVATEWVVVLLLLSENSTNHNSDWTHREMYSYTHTCSSSGEPVIFLRIYILILTSSFSITLIEKTYKQIKCKIREEKVQIFWRCFGFFFCFFCSFFCYVFFFNSGTS